MNILSNIKAASGLYDFASDPSAGAVGSIDLSAPLSTGAMIIQAFVTTYIPFTSAGLATLSFGVVQTDVNPPNFFGQALFVPATAFGSFVTGPPPNSVVLQTSGLKFYSGSYSLCMAIGTAPITAGKVMLSVIYMELPF